MVSRRFHTIAVVGVEVVHPRGMMMRELPTENVLEEKREVLFTHFPIYFKNRVVKIGHTESRTPQQSPRGIKRLGLVDTHSAPPGFPTPSLPMRDSGEFGIPCTPRHSVIHFLL